MPRRNTGPKTTYRKDRNCWEVTVIDRGRRKRLATGFSGREQAQQALVEVLTDIRKPKAKCDPAQRLVGDALADYASEHGPLTTSPATIGFIVKALTPFWGEKTVAQVTKTNCQKYLALRKSKPAKHKGTLSDETVRKELRILRAALNHDVREGRLTVAPPVWLPEESARRERWLTREEVAKLIRAARKDKRCRKHLPWFILIAYYTGMRKTAILELRWPMVDLNQGLINWNPPGRKQTKKRRPIQPMNRRLRLIMRMLRRRGTDMGYVLHIHQRRIRDIRKGFNGAVTTAKLGDEVTPHIMCHTSITHALQRGVPTWEAAGFYGRTEEMIREVYGHHCSGFMATARDALISRK